MANERASRTSVEMPGNGGARNPKPWRIAFNGAVATVIDASGGVVLWSRVEETLNAASSETGDTVAVPRHLLTLVADRGRAAWPFLYKTEREAFNEVGALVGLEPVRVEPLDVLVER